MMGLPMVREPAATPTRPGQRKSRRRGSVLLVSAVLMVALVGLMALTLECGSLMAERRHAQAIADASAMAAACDLTYNFGFNAGLDPQGTARASALATASSSGYANDGVISTVTVNIPPLTGDFAGQAGYAEVLVLYNQQRGLSGIFGSGVLPVTARGVARGTWQPFSTAFLALEPALPAALTVALNASMTVVNGSVIVDSSSLLSTAIALNASITAPVVNLTGNDLTLLNGPINATINTGVAPTPDPLSYLSPPNISSLPVQQSSLLSISLSQPMTLNPGVYYGGIRIAGTANVTMNPGIYYMAGGGFTVAAAASVTGNGVTIVNAPILPTDAISIAATGSLTLTPPTTGLYAGITIMQPPELISLPLNLNPTLTIAANSLIGGSFSLAGTIYAPDSIMALAANANAKVGSQIICRMAAIAGNGNLQIDWTNNTARATLPVKLVE
jgi:hypothetical protein